MVSLVHALDRIPLGGRIIAGPCCGGPTSLLRAVADRSSGRDWLLCAGLLLDDGGVFAATESGDLRVATWHVTSAGRTLIERGLMEYVPVRASQLERHMATWDVDAALVRVTPPDSDGWCSLGPSAGYTLTAVNTAKLRIAEVDEALPRTHGRSRVHVSAFDVLVPSTTDTPAYLSPEPDDVSRAIAEHVIGLLPDRPVLQVGIGRVTEAIVPALAAKNIGGLSFVGMGMDAMVDLLERGLLAEPLGKGPSIESPDLVGTQRLMRFANENPAVAVGPSSEMHSPQRLAALERLVSVNTAVEVDLTGQVNSEVTAGRQIAGIGGTIDFVEAATHSVGGMRIVALASTTRDGNRSRIVARFEANATVTIPRGMVDFVITEHGIAKLEGRTIRERAEALIDVAAPQHRQALIDAMQQQAVTPSRSKNEGS